MRGRVRSAPLLALLAVSVASWLWLTSHGGEAVDRAILATAAPFVVLATLGARGPRRIVATLLAAVAAIATGIAVVHWHASSAPPPSAGVRLATLVVGFVLAPILLYAIGDRDS